MKNILIVLSFIFSFNFLNAQNNNDIALTVSSFKPDYPEGIYATMNDFINKKPSEIIALTPRGFTLKREIFTDVPNDCFFYYTAEDKKVKNTFAICYKGELYFQIYTILENRNKKDNNQEAEFSNAFVKVRNGGTHYFYMEAELGNKWGNALGGGGPESTNVAKGVVWDFKNKEFNIFKNCKDYNEFMQSVYPGGVQNCSVSKEVFLSNVRSDFNFYK